MGGGGLGMGRGSSCALTGTCCQPAPRHCHNLWGFPCSSSVQCTGWLVQPLGANLPADLYAQQWFDRGNAPPIPAGAHRPVAATATEACRTWMGDPQVGGVWALLTWMCCGCARYRRDAQPDSQPLGSADPDAPVPLGAMQQDPLECWHLVYDHCIPGYTSRNWMPKDISYNEKRVSTGGGAGRAVGAGREVEVEQAPTPIARSPTHHPPAQYQSLFPTPPFSQVLASLFNTAAKDGSFGKPPTLPAQYSRLCVANPELAGTGACSKVKPGDFRIHTLGFRPSGWARCDHISGQISFVKAHVDGQFSVGVWGRVGH